MNNKLMMGMALAAVVCSCAGKGGENVQQTVAEKVPVVSVVTATRQTVPQEEVYSSTVQANVVNNIAPQSGNRIVKLNVEVGDFVSAGQVLAEMDRVQLDQAALKLKNDEVELARVKALLGEGGISQSDYDALELAFNVSKSSYQNLLDNTILRAPVSGVVSARNYDRGDMYTMSSPLYVVQQITPVKVLVGVSEADYSRVKKGDKVSITADALPGKTFTGSVLRVYPVIDPASHTVKVEILIPNADRLVRPGMYVRATINMGDRDSIVVPDAAVIKQQGSGQRQVYVLGDDNTVSLKLVTLGRHFGMNYEIISGLEDGDRVVTGGQAGLKSGVKVEVAQ